MAFYIERNDITNMSVDAIVNAANTNLQAGGGVCGAIFHAAGKAELQKECDIIARCNTGDAVITSGYKLSAKYIIHAVGPIWSGGNLNEDQKLWNAYTNSLKLARTNQCESIAFPLISTGIYGFPKERAFNIAKNAIISFLDESDMEVYLVIFDSESFSISRTLFDDIQEYIDDNYVDMHNLFRRDEDSSYPIDYYCSEESITSPNDYLESTSLHESIDLECEKAAPLKHKRSLEDVLSILDESFSEMLLRLIDEKGMTDVQAYKNANIDRKLFSKIRSNKDYRPSKTTVLAFAISLKLNIDETKDLLGKAGFALSHSSKFDVVVEYFIINSIYDIFEINEALFSFNQASLGK